MYKCLNYLCSILQNLYFYFLVYNVYHHDNKNVWTFIRVENDSLVTGYRQTKGWARDKKVFFAMQFSKPFKSYGHKKYDEIIFCNGGDRNKKNITSN